MTTKKPKVGLAVVANSAGTAWGVEMVCPPSKKNLSGLLVPDRNHVTTMDRAVLFGLVQAFSAFKAPSDVTIYSESFFDLFSRMPGLRKNLWMESGAPLPNADLLEALSVCFTAGHVVQVSRIKTEDAERLKALLPGGVGATTETPVPAAKSDAAPPPADSVELMQNLLSECLPLILNGLPLDFVRTHAPLSLAARVADALKA